MRPFRILAWALAVSACNAAPSAGSAPLTSTGSDLRPRTRVTVVATEPDELPLDGPSLVELRLEAPHENARVLEGRFVGGVSFDDAAVVLDGDRRLFRYEMTGEPAPIAEDVAFVPVVTLDGAHLAYATMEAGELHVLDALGDRVVATGLGSIGALSFSPDGARIAFVGARRGGIAGVWLADSRGRDEVRCLTNCELGTGDELSSMVPLPAQPLAFHEGAVRWVDDRGEGHQVEVTP
jgi:hypothetical protein